MANDPDANPDAEPGRPSGDAGPDPQGRDLARQLAGRLSRHPQPPGARSSRSGRSARRRSVKDTEVSGARPDDRDPQTLTSALDRLVDERGWRTETAVHRVLLRWPAVVGPQIADHCVPQGFADSVLTVRADSTAWRTHVTQLAATIVARLNEELGDGTVTRVQVLGPDAPSWSHGRRRVHGGRGPRDTYG